MDTKDENDQEDEKMRRTNMRMMRRTRIMRRMMGIRMKRTKLIWRTRARTKAAAAVDFGGRNGNNV